MSLTNYHAITHPSQPNYFALFAGSTFGADNADHTEPGRTLASILIASGKTFLGYVDAGSPRPQSVGVVSRRVLSRAALWNASLAESYKKFVDEAVNVAMIIDRHGRFDGIITRSAIESRVVGKLIEATK